MDVCVFLKAGVVRSDTAVHKHVRHSECHWSASLAHWLPSVKWLVHSALEGFGLKALGIMSGAHRLTWLVSESSPSASLCALCLLLFPSTPPPPPPLLRKLDEMPWAPPDLHSGHSVVLNVCVWAYMHVRACVLWPCSIMAYFTSQFPTQFRDFLCSINEKMENPEHRLPPWTNPVPCSRVMCHVLSVTVIFIVSGFCLDWFVLVCVSKSIKERTKSRN